jgi:hypothetical protein
MIKGIRIAVMTAFLVASIADGQMRYSRERKPSPTPTPTPQPLIPAQKGTPPSRTTPSPSPLATPQQRMMYPQIQPKPSPTPLQRTMPTANQPKLMATPAQGQARQSPTPLQKLPYGQMPSQVPAQRTFAPQQPAPTPIQSRIPGRQTVTVPQPGTTPIQPRIFATPAPTPAKPTPTLVPPPDVKAYVDKQVGNSKDKKFHMTVNGKDLPLTPFHFWAARSTGFNTTSTHIDMRGDDGRVYDIEFATTGAQISSIRIHRINGEAVR